MARGYSTSGPNASGTANKTMVTIIGSATVRPRIFDAIFGNQATPADSAGLFAISRFTAAGTSAASPPTPLPLDPSDVAAVATAGWTHSAEPTYTAGQDLVQIPLNQRATFRWIASPGFELVGPATAANGLGARLVASTVALVQNADVFHFE